MTWNLTVVAAFDFLWGTWLWVCSTNKLKVNGMFDNVWLSTTLPLLSPKHLKLQCNSVKKCKEMFSEFSWTKKCWKAPVFFPPTHLRKQNSRSVSAMAAGLLNPPFNKGSLTRLVAIVQSRSRFPWRQLISCVHRQAGLRSRGECVSAARTTRLLFIKMKVDLWFLSGESWTSWCPCWCLQESCFLLPRLDLHTSGTWEFSCS